MRTREKEVEDQKLRLSVLEKEERNAHERIRGLTDQVDQRTYNIDKTNGRLDTVLKDCEQVKGAVGNLDFQIGDFSRANSQAAELQKRLFR